MLATFKQTVALHGIPASTLTDNGMVFTTRLSGGKGGRNHLETELRRLGVLQKNGRPWHPQTQGKVCESDVGVAPAWPDPGQGMTTVSCVRFVGQVRCSTAERTGQTDLT